MSLPCPECGQPTRVLQTRRLKEYVDRIFRRRACSNCGHRFTTTEKQPETNKGRLTL